MKEKLFELVRKEAIVNVGEGVDIIVKELTAGEASEYATSLVKFENGKRIPVTKDMQVKLVALACYEPNGERMFKTADIEKIKQLPSTVVDKLYLAADKINSGEGKN